MPLRRLVLLALAGTAGLILGCGQRPEQRILTTAGFEGAVRCAEVEGVERTSMCGLHLSRADAVLLAHRLGLKPLTVPERIGGVTNIVALPTECRILHFDNPHPMTLSTVFDSPFALNDRASGTQFASLLLARAPSGQSCLTFVREFG
jgi:hypothetical protein